MTDEEALRNALNEKTRIFYLETPANPTLKITDIAKTAEIAHSFNPEIKVICDNTFCTPYIQRPLELGADIVVHSATKYLNGHGDLLAGAIISDAETIGNILLVGIKVMTGAVLAPNESYLLMRGLKTLAVRMERHCSNAMKVAEFLNSHDKIETVYFPGLADHPGRDIAEKQMSSFGAMISFIVKGGRKNAAVVADSVKIAALAVSLGSPETLIEHPASMTHSTYNDEELLEAGIPGGLVRLSVGLEDPEDIISDLAQALDKVEL
jgi:methionine-gamma-lyase